MVAEVFTPADTSRLSSGEYSELTEVTLNRLILLEPPIEEENALEQVLGYQQQARFNVDASTEQLINGGSVKDWESQATDIIVNGLLIALLIGYGGIEQVRQSIDPRSLLGLGVDLIKGQRRAIKNNADKIAAGGFTLGRLKDLGRRRSLAVRSSYESASIAQAMAERFHNEGIRRLTSPHPCPDCPTYERTDWVSINEIVPVATACVCKGNCKCIVTTRFNPARVIQELQGGTLFNQVRRRREFLQQVEQEYLERHGW